MWEGAPAVQKPTSVKKAVKLAVAVPTAGLMKLGSALVKTLHELTKKGTGVLAATAGMVTDGMDGLATQIAQIFRNEKSELDQGMLPLLAASALAVQVGIWNDKDAQSFYEAFHLQYRSTDQQARPPSSTTGR